MRHLHLYVVLVVELVPLLRFIQLFLYKVRLFTFDHRSAAD